MQKPDSASAQNSSLPLSPEGVPENLPLYPANGATTFGPEVTFHSLIETLRLGVNYCDPGEHLLYVNQALADMTGYSQEEMIGKTSYDIIIPQEEQGAVRTHIAARMQGVAEHYEVQMRRKDGTRFWAFVSAAPVRDAQGGVCGSVAIIQDISERKHSLDAIQESERKYRNLVETVSDLIWAVDAEGCWTFVNRACKAIYGFEPYEMLGRRFVEFQSPEQADIDRQVFARILAGAPCFNYVTEHRRKDGSAVKLRFNAIPLRNNVGQVVGTTGTAADITEQMRIAEESQNLQRQLLKSQKLEAVGQLAAGIAHDLNNALGAVVGHLQLMKASTDMPSALVRSADVALSGCQRASTLIEQLLGFARRGKYNFQIAHLGKFVGETVQFVSRIIEKENTIVQDAVVEDYFVRMDEGQIQQAIVNLILNAQHAMPQGGTITLRCGEQFVADPGQFNSEAKGGAYIWLSVSDSGVGIPARLIDKVFEPFFTTKADGKGSGLGLAMVYGIMQRHGGWVEVQSTPGRGSTFTLYFPKAHPIVSEVREGGKISSSKVSSNGRGTILVIDDEPELVELAKIFMEQAGLQAHTETRARDAIDWYRFHWQTVDMVLLDLKMPEMSGAVCFDELRAINPNAQIVLVTGYVQDEEADRLLQAGALKFFQKPIRYPELVSWMCIELERLGKQKNVAM